jgi:hypothetical protein
MCFVPLLKRTVIIYLKCIKIFFLIKMARCINFMAGTEILHHLLK